MSIIKDTDRALRVLAVQVIDAGADFNYSAHNPVLDKMLKEIKIMLEDHEQYYRTVAENLTGEKVDQVLAACFDDGKINWGRIVAVFTLLYVFAGKYKDCCICRRALMNGFIAALQKEVTPWIRNRGGISDYVYPCNHHMCLAQYFVIALCAVVMLNDACH